MCNIRWYVIITGTSVKGLLIEPIIGEIVVNNNAEAGGIFFGKPVGQQGCVRWRGYGIQFSCVE